MFKIQDNEDGSTSVYCRNSGNLLCTLPAKQNSNVPRRVNVVEPQPAAGSLESSWHLSRRNSTQLANGELIRPKDEPCNDPVTSFRESKCCISPIPISPDGDQSEDYFDDCITQEAFAKCLNLVSKEKLRTQERSALLAEYPLRLLSRSKAYRTLEDLRDLKLPDYMPLTSYLGMKILELNKSRNFTTQQKVQISVKNYNSYCRIPFNAPKPTGCPFPKLRCREKKMYPIATTAKTLRHDANHVYTYGRRQRQERMMVMATGLNKRSRKLMELCKKKCFVKLKRLTRAEINSWKKRTPPPHSGAIYYSTHQWNPNAFSNMLEYNPPPGTSILKSNLQSLNSFNNQVSSNCSLPRRSFSGLSGTSSPLQPDSQLAFLLTTPRRMFATSSSTQWTHPRFLSSHLRFSAHDQNKCNRKCSVPLINVMRCIHKRGGQYFVKGTRIRVPFYADFLGMLEARQLRCVGSGSGADLNVRSDHAYSSLSKQSSAAGNQAFKTQKIPLKPRNAEPDSSSRNAQYRNASPGGDERIPLIDLTVDTTPPKAGDSLAMSRKQLATQYKFRCFACGFHRLYFNTNLPGREAAAEAAIRDHMVSLHSVVEPECFLSKYLDRVNKCLIVEAFPGYKDTSD